MTTTTKKLLNITRTDSELFKIKSSFPHWSDGSPISGTFAFRNGSLSDTAAQTINRARGIRYLIISPLTIKSAAACAAAAALSIGESCAVEISPAPPEHNSMTASNQIEIINANSLVNSIERDEHEAMREMDQRIESIKEKTLGFVNWTGLSCLELIEAGRLHGEKDIMNFVRAACGVAASLDELKEHKQAAHEICRHFNISSL